MALADQPDHPALTIMLDLPGRKVLTSRDQLTHLHQAIQVHLAAQWAVVREAAVAAVVPKAVPDQEEAEDNYLI